MELTDHAVHRDEPEGVPFWLSACSYWQPEHLPPTPAWMTHAPFGFWLMDVVRPRTVVELGTHYGMSCFVFAEAAKRLGIDCTVNALDTWEGDDHAGFYGEQVYETVKDVVDREYPDSVRLLRGYFSDSRPLIENASVDLLHIDGRHGYDDVLEDFTAWKSAVRDGGIVLFHDTAERRGGFEVWRLWHELSGEYPSFSFEHGHGLGVLAVGRVAHPHLRALFEADTATAARIRADYARLGGKVALQRSLEVRSEELDSIVASRSWRMTAPFRFVWALPGRVGSRLRARRG